MIFRSIYHTDPISRIRFLLKIRRHPLIKIKEKLIQLIQGRPNALCAVSYFFTLHSYVFSSFSFVIFVAVVFSALQSSKLISAPRAHSAPQSYQISPGENTARVTATV